MAQEQENTRRTDSHNEEEPQNRKSKQFRRKGLNYREEAKKIKPNDVSWYAGSAQLLKDAASLAFSNPQGIAVDEPGIYLPSYPINVYYAEPSIGKANLASDPVTVAARQIYSFVRHANSGSANYEAPDLMMYLLAMGELYSVYGWLTRAYGLLRFFNGMNRAVPKHLFDLLGLQYDDFIQHIADYRLFINQTVRKINSFFVPKHLPYFMRKLFIYSGVYKDSPEDKAEIFFLQPESFLQFDGTSDPNGSKLRRYVVPTMANSPMTFSQLVTYVNNLMDPLLAEEDINIMSGDILKAYQKDVLALNEIDENYLVVPEFSGEMIAQFHNASVLYHNSIPGSSFEVTQTSTGVIQQTKVVSIAATNVATGLSNTAFSKPQILDADDDTSPEYVMTATRLKAFGNITTNGSGDEIFTITECGTEVIVKAATLMISNTGTAIYQGLPFAVDAMGSNAAGELGATDTVVARVHYAPLRYVYNSTNSYTNAIHGEINNFTLLLPYTQYKMDTVAFLSLFGVSAGPVGLVRDMSARR